MAKGPIRVAIIGGGLGGTVLMNSLMKYSHIDAQIYEAKDSFGERGASVGLSINAQRALSMMGLRHVYEKAGAVPVHGARVIMGAGPDEGKMILDFASDLVTVHRGALLRELVDPIPTERMHVNKQVTDIEGQTITFADGTTAIADVIIGADGIHSCVRKFVLKDDPDSIDAVSAGIFDCRVVVPFKTALDTLGSECMSAESPRQTIYCGDGNIFLIDHIDNGNSICVIASGVSPTDWGSKDWKRTVSRQWLLDRYQKWPAYAKDVIDVLCNGREEIPVFMQWESGPTKKIYDGTACLMGDAAHATTPWHGAGLGQAIENALLISKGLGQCRSLQDVPTAFRAYDALARPRGRTVIDSSREVAMLFCGQQSLTAGELGETLRPRWKFIHNWDTEAAVAAVENAIRTATDSHGVAM